MGAKIRRPVLKYFQGVEEIPFPQASLDFAAPRRTLDTFRHRDDDLVRPQLSRPGRAIDDPQGIVMAQISERLARHECLRRRLGPGRLFPQFPPHPGAVLAE